MAYLRLKDYELRIQSTALSQYTANSSINKRVMAEGIALSEIKSYLIQKYDLTEEFRDTTVFDKTKTYKANDLVELDATAYVALTAYSVGNLVSKGGNVYTCIQAGTGHDPETATAYWTKVGVQYDLYYVTLPNPVFNYRSIYKKGDIVFWKNKVYTAVLDSPLNTHDTILQSGTYENVPIYNVFPDDSINGAQYWGTGSSYSVSAGVLPSDATKWTQGDNRCGQLLVLMIDFSIYHMAPSIASKNNPDQRNVNYNNGIDWLHAASRGELTADIPLIQPKAGRRIRYGGNVKNTNTY